MADTSTAPLPAQAAPLSLPARIVGILTAPRATYADVAAGPRWAGMLAFIVCVGSVGTFTFLSTDVGREAMLDQAVTRLESFGMKLPDEAYGRMEQGLQRARYTTPLSQVIVLPLMATIVAGVLIGIFNAILGGRATFKQVYAVVVHSGVITMVSQLFSLPLAYARGSMSGATNIGVFFPFLDERSFAARLLGSIDLFMIWWLVSLSIGLGVLYRRKTAPIANGLIGAYVVIGFVIAAVQTALSGA